MPELMFVQGGLQFRRRHSRCEGTLGHTGVDGRVRLYRRSQTVGARSVPWLAKVLARYLRAIVHTSGAVLQLEHETIAARGSEPVSRSFMETAERQLECFGRTFKPSRPNTWASQGTALVVSRTFEQPSRQLEASLWARTRTNLYESSDFV
jgi:hypothetical protein